MLKESSGDPHAEASLLVNRTRFLSHHCHQAVAVGKVAEDRAARGIRRRCHLQSRWRRIISGSPSTSSNSHHCRQIRSCYMPPSPPCSRVQAPHLEALLVSLSPCAPRRRWQWAQEYKQHRKRVPVRGALLAGTAAPIKPSLIYSVH